MVEVVAVIGAGASGLVASRHLMRCGLRPFVLEQAASSASVAAPARGGAGGGGGVGGAWNVRSGKFWDTLQPNLSRYTQCFSDFSWSNVLSDDHDGHDGAPSMINDYDCYPSRAQVHQYLDRYATEHEIQPQFGCKVTRVERKGKITSSSTSTSSLVDSSVDASSSSASYRVTWLDSVTGQTQSDDFDRVVIATGFFADPIFPDCVRSLVSSTTDGIDSEDDDNVVIHSSQYANSQRFANQTVAVVGSAFSGLEICSDLCRHATSVVSVLPSVPWVLPRYVPCEDGSLPLDMALYRRKTDAPQPQVTVMDETAIRARYQFLHSLLGTRKQASTIGIPELDVSRPPTAVISDDYLNLVSSGRIQVMHGRLHEATRRVESGGKLRLGIRDRSGNVQEVEVDSMICCTGYKSNLQFLDPDLRHELEYDDADPFMPLSLAYDAIHPNMTGLGFVGMYRGVFFGVMELQARLLAELWSGNLPSVDQDTLHAAVEMSRSVRNHQPRAQFPQFDVVGCMDRLASVLNLVPPHPYGAKGMIVTPSYYQPSLVHSQQAHEGIERQVECGWQGKHMPGIVLSALVGKWTFERTIEHYGTDARTERVRGTVRYTVAGPGLDAVRYREDGVFLLPNGREIDVFREYEYSAHRDSMEIHFVEDGRRSNLFLGLQFQPQREQGCWEATSDHLCIKDLYRGTFQVYLDGISASKVVMTYRVKGPNKDYESVTILTPKLG